MAIDMNLIEEASKLQHSVEDAKAAGKAISAIAVSDTFYKFCESNTPNWDKTLYGHTVKVDKSLATTDYRLE
ncbi:MAG: hypothetical protein GX297_01240 [Treponema sp.]|jgi:hypothetical protein|nr:hypothetical protein [Treponema sp.]